MLNGPRKFAVALVLGVGAVLFAVGLLAALMTGHSVSRSLGNLQVAAAALHQRDQHRSVIPKQTVFREANQVADALSLASNRLQVVEDQSRLAVEAADLGTWSWDLTTDEFSSSIRLRKMFGLDENMEHAREAFFNCIHPTDQVVIEEALKRLMREGDRFDLQYRISMANEGICRWLNSCGGIERNKFGRGTRINGVVQDITSHRESEHEREELRRRLIQGFEQERVRLARELHDQAGQIVAAAMLELGRIEAAAENDAVRRLRNQLQEIDGMIHHIAYELRPASIDELGLTESIKNYILEWGTRFGIKTDSHLSAAEVDGLPDDIRTTAYRIIQEALTNVVKHTKNATSVSVVISRAEGTTLRIVVEDDGCGIGTDRIGSNTRKGLGLAGMRERLAMIGGELTIESGQEIGTTILVRIPIKERGQA